MYEVSKRGLDITVSAVAIFVTLPLWGLIAAAIRLTSRGPVFYRAERVGRGGAPFQMFKFRSMRLTGDAPGPSITGAGDARITPAGRFLRVTKLDELPQLVNVLRGEMSLVGPRPEIAEYVRLYSSEQRQVLEVRPGITGLTQIRFRHEERLLTGNDLERAYRDLLPRKLELDLRYVRTRSLALDLTLLLATTRSLVSSGPATVEERSW